MCVLDTMGDMRRSLAVSPPVGKARRACGELLLERHSLTPIRNF
jgi:hypothetical protein